MTRLLLTVLALGLTVVACIPSAPGGPAGVVTKQWRQCAGKPIVCRYHVKVHPKSGGDTEIDVGAWDVCPIGTTYPACLKTGK